MGVTKWVISLPLTGSGAMNVAPARFFSFLKSVLMKENMLIAVVIHSQNEGIFTLKPEVLSVVFTPCLHPQRSVHCALQGGQTAGQGAQALESDPDSSLLCGLGNGPTFSELVSHYQRLWEMAATTHGSGTWWQTHLKLPVWFPAVPFCSSLFSSRLSAPAPSLAFVFIVWGPCSVTYKSLSSPWSPVPLGRQSSAGGLSFVLLDGSPPPGLRGSTQ